MARAERLQQILQAAARITHAIGRLDSVAMQALGEARESAVDEIVASGDASGTRRPQFAVQGSQSESEIEARLDDVPAVDEQHRDAAVARDDCADALRDHFEQPRRALDYLRTALGVGLGALLTDLCQLATAG